MGHDATRSSTMGAIIVTLLSAHKIQDPVTASAWLKMRSCIACFKWIILAGFEAWTLSEYANWATAGDLAVNIVTGIICTIVMCIASSAVGERAFPKAQTMLYIAAVVWFLRGGWLIATGIYFVMNPQECLTTDVTVASGYGANIQYNTNQITVCVDIWDNPIIAGIVNFIWALLALAYTYMCFVFARKCTEWNTVFMPSGTETGDVTAVV